MRDYQIISADSHVVEPPDLWEKWLEKKYLDTAPKLVDDGDGGDAWIYMGRPDPEPLGLVTCVGTRPEELKWTGAKYGVTIHPACHDGAERLRSWTSTASTPRCSTRRSARCSRS